MKYDMVPVLGFLLEYRERKCLTKQGARSRSYGFINRGNTLVFLQRSRFFKPHDRNLTVFFIGVFWWYIGRSLFKRIDKEKINLGPLTRSVPYVQSCFAFSEEKKKPINRPIPAVLIHVLRQVTLILILTETRYMYYDHFNRWRRIEVTLILQIKINIPISKYIYPKNLTQF